MSTAYNTVATNSGTSIAEKAISITKASGAKANFDESKLRRSLEHSGANNEVINHIISTIKNDLYDGIAAKKIYKKAFALLRKSSRTTAARYKLKKAIYELGPTGYPFEKFVAAILNYQDFDTQVNALVKGHCVTHEVDVIAIKENKHYMVECKFHQDAGRHCDVKVPLYINSRFKDIERQWKKGKDGHQFHKGWIFTNTRFTSDAIKFGNCSGLMLIGWDFPSKGSLKERIDISGLHPVTCLTTITKHEKNQLLDKEIVLCKELFHNPELLSKIGIKVQRHKKIMQEAGDLCNT